MNIYSPAAEVRSVYPVGVVGGLLSEEVELILEPVVTHLVLLQPLQPGLGPQPRGLLRHLRHLVLEADQQQRHQLVPVGVPASGGNLFLQISSI